MRQHKMHASGGPVSNSTGRSVGGNSPPEEWLEIKEATEKECSYRFFRGTFFTSVNHSHTLEAGLRTNDRHLNFPQAMTIFMTAPPRGATFNSGVGLRSAQCLGSYDKHILVHFRPQAFRFQAFIYPQR